MRHVITRTAATRTAAVGLTTAVALGGVVAVAEPASAATRCGPYQPREFDTPGFNVDLKIRLCVSNSNGVHAAIAQGNWNDGGGLTAKFDKIYVTLRPERNNVNKGRNACSLTNSINLYDEGKFSRNGTSHNDTRCGFFASSTSNLDGGWTADGTVTYNINEDGKGDRVWHLKGSPPVK
jgi:hypothetical protein